MKNFIIKITLFILPLVLLMYPADLILSALLRKTSGFYGEMEIWNDIYKSKINCRMAIYGSSRAWVQFDPGIIEDSLEMPVYNFGIDGLNFRMQYFRHREYLKNNTPPDYIIHSVDIFNLGINDELYNREQFLPFMLWNWDFYQGTRALKGYQYCDYFIPVIRYYGKIPMIYRSWYDLRHTFRDHGFRSDTSQWNDDLNRARNVMGSYQVGTDPYVLNLYSQFLNECKSSGITVVMVYSPIYILGQQFIEGYQENVDFYKEVARKNQLIFLDYTNDSLCYNRSYFYNSTHLNAKGSEIFSRNLAHDLKQILDLTEKRK